MDSDNNTPLAVTFEHNLMEARIRHAETQDRLVNAEAKRQETAARLRAITATVWYKLGKALGLCP
jgi:hypothetical protein